jgi:pimeloyl-ACP methyl ester carboxylesterase
VTEILDHYEKIIRELESSPFIMGHSFGGGFTQVLLDRGLGAAGVAVDSATVKGVFKLPLSTLRSGWPVLKNPANRHKAVGLSAKQFHYAFTNTLSEDESAKVYERYHIPGPGGVLFEGATVNLPGTALRVDFGKADRAPLLFIAGGADHIVPPAANRSNVKLYRKSKSEAIVHYKEFPGRLHYTLRLARTSGARMPHPLTLIVACEDDHWLVAGYRYKRRRLKPIRLKAFGSTKPEAEQVQETARSVDDDPTTKFLRGAPQN